MRHLIDIRDLSAQEIAALLDLADAVYDTKRTFAQIELEPYRRFH